MQRLIGRLIGGLVLALVVPLGTAGPASAGPPRIYHTIRADLGYAVVDRTVGCTRTQAFVSSTVAMYAAQPGPVTKQGFTDVQVIVSDVCAAPAAAPGGGVVIAEYSGRAAVPLSSDPRLRQASVTAQMHDVDDPGVLITLAVRWTGVGPLDHTTTHIHNRFPGEGVISSSANDLRRAADAVVTLRVGNRVDLRSVPAAEAVLERTKSRCLENPRPGVEGFYPCFGFPG